MTKRMVRFEDVSYTFKNQETFVLDHISLEAKRNEFVTLIGPSGCGKTTVFKLMSGLETGYVGKIEVDGQDLQRRKPMVSYMQQKDTLLPWRTVYDNIQLPLELKGRGKDEIKSKLSKMIPEFGLEGFESVYPKHLSGGMRQRAVLLRTFLQESAIMLLDEPFGALDALTRSSMQDWLLKVWTQYKKTILFITHDIDEAIFMSDRIYVFGPRPAKVVDCVSIVFERPRNREILLTEEFLIYKKRLIDLLK